MTKEHRHLQYSLALAWVKVDPENKIETYLRAKTPNPMIFELDYPELYHMKGYDRDQRTRIEALVECKRLTK